MPKRGAFKGGRNWNQNNPQRFSGNNYNGMFGFPQKNYLTFQVHHRHFGFVPFFCTTVMKL